VRGTLNGRWDEGCLTGPVILGTFQTFEGSAVIKSELIDRNGVRLDLVGGGFRGWMVAVRARRSA